MTNRLTSIFDAATGATIYSNTPPSGGNDWPEIAATIADTYCCHADQVATDPDNPRAITAAGVTVAYYG